MRSYFCLLFFVCFSFTIQAQIESSRRKVSISAVPQKPAKQKAITNETPQSTLFSPLKFESKIFKNPDDKFLRGLPELPKIGEAPEKKYELKNPADDYTAKMNAKMADSEFGNYFQKDYVLAMYKCSTMTAKFVVRDFGIPDGDAIRIWLNGEVVIPVVNLDVDYKEIQLKLKKGQNTIEIEALNVGYESPNTAQFVITNEKGKVVGSNTSGMLTGVKATVIINQEDVLEE